MSRFTCPLLVVLVFPLWPALGRGEVLTIPDTTVFGVNTVRGLGPMFTVSGDFLVDDIVSVRAQGTVDLASGLFTTNAAGVIVAPEVTNTGNSPGQVFAPRGLRFGAVLIGNESLGYFHLFPANASTGLGSSTPPTDIAMFNVRLGDIFTSPSFTGLADGTVLDFVIHDSHTFDNSGSMTLTSAITLPVFTLPDVMVPEGTSGSLALQCAHDFPMVAFSVSIRYRPEDIEVLAVTTAGTSVEGLDLFEGGVVPATGEIAYRGRLSLDMLPERFLPPAPDHTLLRIDYRVIAPAGTMSPVVFENGLGAVTPVFNVFTGDDQLSVEPQLESGVVRVTQGEPPGEPAIVVDAGPDQLEVELGVVVLQGLSSQPDPGAAMTFSWRQLVGPPVLSIAGADTRDVTINLPAVVGDTPLVFELEVSDGISTGRDTATVTVIDVDLRRADIVLTPLDEVLALAGGTRLVLFDGEVTWQTGVEDAVWSKVRFTEIGEGDESELLEGATLYFDSDGNGVPDDGDEVLGAVSPLPEDGTVEFQFAKVLQEGNRCRFLLVVDVSAGEETGGSEPLQGVLLFPMGLALLLGWRLTGRKGVAHRARNAFVVMILVCAALAPTACADGGRGIFGAASDKSTEVGFAILGDSDFHLEGSTTHLRVTPSGLPLEGFRVEL